MAKNIDENYQVREVYDNLCNGSNSYGDEHSIVLQCIEQNITIIKIQILLTVKDKNR